MTDLQKRPAIEIMTHDAHIDIWQGSALPFRSEIYCVIIRQMRERGWSIRRDPDVHRLQRSISHSRRLGARGTLRCAIAISGRVVEVDFWSITAQQVNRSGRRYDFDKMKRMHHSDRLLVEMEFRRIAAVLETLSPTKKVLVKVSRSEDMPAVI